ncbi:hypothetical protein LTR86_002290 [Recurvomyces mirabilis]|nr:hypothetical protein LTR86_002290 [Recurvomyces mirabilis]
MSPTIYGSKIILTPVESPAAKPATVPAPAFASTNINGPPTPIKTAPMAVHHPKYPSTSITATSLPAPSPSTPNVNSTCLKDAIEIYTHTQESATQASSALRTLRRRIQPLSSKPMNPGTDAPRKIKVETELWTRAWMLTGVKNRLLQREHVRPGKWEAGAAAADEEELRSASAPVLVKRVKGVSFSDAIESHINKDLSDAVGSIQLKTERKGARL